MQELHMASDYALWAINVTAQTLGRGMSTLLVQERHYSWLNLTWVAEKVLFSPISLFGYTVEDFAQQLSTVKKQTEAIKHILPRCKSASTSGPQRQQALLACRWGPPSVKAAPTPPGPAARPKQWSSRRKVALPAHQQAIKNPRKALKRTWDVWPRDVLN